MVLMEISMCIKSKYKVKHTFIPSFYSFYSFTQQTPTGVSQTGLFLGSFAGCGKGLYPQGSKSLEDTDGEINSRVQ